MYVDAYLYKSYVFNAMQVYLTCVSSLRTVSTLTWLFAYSTYWEGRGLARQSPTNSSGSSTTVSYLRLQPFELQLSPHWPNLVPRARILARV